MPYAPKPKLFLLSWFSPLLISLLVVFLVFIFIETIVLSTPPDPAEEITVFIPEGKTVREIDLLLRSAGVLKIDESLLDATSPQRLEGYLFPDTYRFYASSTAQSVIDRFFNNFKKKAEPLLKKDVKNYYSNLILASLVEREVPDYSDRQVVAGLLKKRLAIGMPLQVDATLCYIKHYRDQDIDGRPQSCYPITKKDKEIDSLYNTYLYKGLPPGPIANPGLEAIEAVMDAKESPYWFYLSDPYTNQTVFSRTLEEHNSNRYRYLSGS